MASDQQIITWALKYSDRLGLKMTRLKWTERFAKGFFDYQVDIGRLGISGRGRSTNQVNALAKAVSEALERVAVMQAGLSNTSGTAAHYDLSIARTSARAELIERDVFLCHFLTQTPFYPLSKGEVSEVISGSVQLGRERGMDVEFFECIRCGTLRTILCCIGGERTHKPFGLSIGLAASSNVHVATERAYMEALSKALWSQSVAYSFNGHLTQEVLSLRDHQNAALDPEYLPKFRSIFLANPRPGVAVKNCKSSNFTFKELELNIEGVGGAPVSIVRASSDQVQTLFSGNAGYEKLNMERIRSFADECAQNVVINHEIPHPLS